MNAHEMYDLGLLDARGAILAALISDGWDPEQANALLAEHTEAASSPAPVRAKWSRWTPDELTEIDKVIADAGGRIPGVGVTRPLASTLGRSHKSVIAQIERRIAAASA
jgi:hypothetical protein